MLRRERIRLRGLADAHKQDEILLRMACDHILAELFWNFVEVHIFSVANYKNKEALGELGFSRVLVCLRHVEALSDLQHFEQRS